MSVLSFEKARVRVDNFIPQPINLVRSVDFLLDMGYGQPILKTVEFKLGNPWDEWCFDKIYKYVKAAEKRGAYEQCFQVVFEWDCETKTVGNLVAVARDGTRSLWYPTKLWADLNGKSDLPKPLYKEELVKSWEKMQEHESSQSEEKSVGQVLTTFLTDGNKEIEDKVSEVIKKLISEDSK